MLARALPAAMAVLLWAGPAAAVELDDLYDVRVEVDGQGDDERERGFLDGLEQVIVRASGRSDVLAEPEVEPILDDPAGYIQTYRYRSIPDGEREDAEEEDDSASHYLEMSFNDERLARDLRESGVVMWGGRRPEILLWVAVEGGRDRYIIGADDGADARAELRRHAQRRGLPLLFPLLDVEDQGRVDFIDIRARFLDAVAEASERYRAEVMLVGHVEQRAEADWSAEWTLVADDREIRWEGTGRTRDEALGSGVGGATDRLAEMMAGQEGEETSLYITVEAVETMSDYTRVADYLAGLVRVRSAEVDRVSADRARFRVRLQGRPQDLERTLSLGDLLRPVAHAGDAVGADEQAMDELDRLVDDLLEADRDDPRADAEEGEGAPAGAAGIELVYRLTG